MMLKLALSFILFATPAFASGPETDFPIDDPCDVAFPTFAEYRLSVIGADPEALYQMAKAIRSGLCGDVPSPLDSWRAKGFTDDQLLAVIFNGTRAPPPISAIPVPGGGALLLSGLGLLALIKPRGTKGLPT